MIKTLFSNKWVSIMEKTMDLDGREVKWIYSHNEWCNGIGVAILPYSEQITGDHISRIYLGRYELCPAHGDKQELTCIMGGYDNADKFSLIECALNELKEEAGYIGLKENVKFLGTVKPNKASSTEMYLFTIKIDENTEQCEINGDGSVIEEYATNKWIIREDIINSESSLLISLYAKLNETI